MKNKAWFYKATKLAAQYQKRIYIVLVLACFMRILKPYIYIYIIAKIVDLLAAGITFKSIFKLISVGVFLHMFASLLEYWFSNLLQEYKDGLNAFEKNAVTKKLMILDYEKIDGTEFGHLVLQHRDELAREGGILYKFISCIERLCNSFWVLFFSVIALQPFLRKMFSSVGPTFVQSRWFVLIVCLTTVCFIICISYFRESVEQRNLEMYDQYAKHSFIFSYYKNLICRYSSGKEIRIFNQQPLIMNQINNEVIEKGIPILKRIGMQRGVASAINELVFKAVLFAIYLAVGIRAREGVYSISEALITIGCFQQLVETFDNITEVRSKMHALKPRILRYEMILSKATQFNSIQNECLGEAVKKVPVIAFSNVSFKYDCSDDYAVKNLNITIRPNEKIAIVGENGSGKTTFVKLLCGLHKPTFGKITIDGINNRTFKLEKYYEMFSVMFQDYKLFALSVGENVAAHRTVDREKAEKILKKLGFPEKYDLDTIMYRDLDSQGIEFSGGETQKIAIARAIYKDAPVVILDEPTASLDPYAEYMLYKQFNELTNGKTAIYISHRLSSCRFCDRILVFDNGEIVQSGSHEDLLADPNGKYFSLWNAQARFFND